MMEECRRHGVLEIDGLNELLFGEGERGRDDRDDGREYSHDHGDAVGRGGREEREIEKEVFVEDDGEDEVEKKAENESDDDARDGEEKDLKKEDLERGVLAQSDDAQKSQLKASHEGREERQQLLLGGAEHENGDDVRCHDGDDDVDHDEDLLEESGDGGERLERGVEEELGGELDAFWQSAYHFIRVGVEASRGEVKSVWPLSHVVACVEREVVSGLDQVLHCQVVDEAKRVFGVCGCPCGVLIRLVR